MRSFRPFLLAVLVGATLVACAEPAPPLPRSPQVVPKIGAGAVLAGVQRAALMRALPAGLTPPLAKAATDIGFNNSKCEAGPTADRIVSPCVWGDRAAGYRVVLYGDSHAGMWLPAVIGIAQRRHWRVELYGKPGCPAPAITVWNRRPLVECDRFRSFVLARVQASHPDLVLVASDSYGQKTGPGVPVDAVRWRAGMVRTLAALGRSGARVAVIGDTPVLDRSAPECLAVHRTNPAACSSPRSVATARIWNAADRAAAATYVDVLPWLCTATCPAVVGSILVYRDRFHLTATYARLLSGALEGALLSKGV